ncbi:MAG TPA: NUDIX hydrolase [Vicinamibacterales bacterium]|nr:NUDIX hydrolase [Vicinamibacterales bacterium]
MSFDRRYPSRPIVGVGAAVFASAADAQQAGWTGHAPELGVILVRRATEPLKGRWSLPGGAVEAGETLEAAIRREVLEETGLDVRVGSVVDVFDRILLDADGRAEYHFVLIDYVCRVRGGTLCAGSDVDDVVVADPDRLQPYQLTEKAIEVIGKAMAHAVEK